MEQKWISVSERLPKKNKKVIIFTKTENFYIGTYCQNIDKEQDGVFLIRDNIYMQIDRIAAWMPLPEPYRGEEPKQTNADRIRNLTDEELAAFCCKVKADYQWADHEYPDEDACGDWEEWLRAESEG